MDVNVADPESRQSVPFDEMENFLIGCRMHPRQVLQTN